MSKTVKVIYNADTLQTTIMVDGQPFDTSRIDGKEIEDWAYPFMMRKVKWNGFYDEMVDALGGEKEFNLIFDGSDEALAELKEAWEDAPVTVVSENDCGNTVVIEYDENTLTTNITVNGQPFDTSRINGKEIEDWVYPFMIRKVKWDGIFEELAKVVGTNEYTIQFDGSEIALKILSEEVPNDVSICVKTYEFTADMPIPDEVKYIFDGMEQFMLGRVDSFDDKSEEEQEEIFKIITRYADLGNCDAICYVALLAMVSEDKEININDIIDTLKSIAMKGHAKAQYLLAMIYYGSFDEETENQDEGYKWLEKSANLEYAPAQYLVGEAYFNGESVSIDYDEAFKMFENSAKQGYLYAQCKLGFCYEFCYGTEQDYKEAIKLYKLAAKSGLDEAQNRLGNLYFNGNGVSTTYKEAIKWFNSAAEQLYAPALCNLATCYRYGQFGCQKNVQQAIDLYLQASEQGYVYAQYYLGNIYEFEKGYIDHEKALNWYNIAIENGLPVDIDNIGMKYRNGYEGEDRKNEETALELYIQAAEYGDAWAQHRIESLNGTAAMKAKKKAEQKQKNRPQKQVVNTTTSQTSAKSGFTFKNATDTVNKVVGFVESDTGQNILKVGRVVGKIGMALFQANQNRKASYNSSASYDYYDDDEY